MDRTARKLVAAVVILAALVIAAWAVRAGVEAFDPFGLGRGPYSERGTTVVEALRELSELTTVEAVEATTIERGNDRGILNFLAGDRIAMLVVARVGAGVDLTGLAEEPASSQAMSSRRTPLRQVSSIPPAAPHGRRSVTSSGRSGSPRSASPSGRADRGHDETAAGLCPSHAKASRCRVCAA